ncbi:N-acetylglucosamine-6-phosphate deacetylase [Sneathiella litorea]|uniref:N-acetylglucosamine-6-phosphate deacetylase n=1 Tax=Sneathiella litorea TaxID=2606216 RepID=A0A6L8W579_9PROT|nr:N-acetylglucosamine-6-phosphate deacetylase [Sneathiella litorea]MZR30261.1 N-acetylglucosamine-6-phosphate deacetylase [Sneathiella litorea]
MKKALVNSHILTGHTWQDELALLIEDEKISGLCRVADCPVGYECEDLAGGYLLPGFIDIQVNGGGGMMLNDARTLADIETIAAAHRKFGTTGMLPTLITDSWERMTEVAALIREAIAKGVPGILGIHFEGPYLNPVRNGVHDKRQIRALDDKFIDLVTQGDLGCVLVTLAPEKVPLETIRKLTAKGVRVSAGHSAASFDEMTAAIDAGLTGTTHLFNAMPPMESRSPGLIGAALTCPDCYCGIINDGHHVHPATLKVVIAAKGIDRLMLVTDAMSTIGTDMTEFHLGDTLIKLKDGRLTTEEGTLAGSALDMATAIRNATSLLGLPLEEALPMATCTPATYLGLEKSRGRIATGYRADLVLVDAGMNVLKSWIAGR